MDAGYSRDLLSMGIKELKTVIDRAGLSSGDCFDKDALRERAAQAVAKLAACQRAQAEARGALVPVAPREPVLAPVAPPAAPEVEEIESKRRLKEQIRTATLANSM